LEQIPICREFAGSVYIHAKRSA